MSIQERILEYLSAHPEGATTTTLYQEMNHDDEFHTAFFLLASQSENMFYLRMPSGTKLWFITERGKVRLEQIKKDRKSKLETDRLLESEKELPFVRIEKKLDNIEQKLDRIEQLVQAIADRVLKSDQN